jgi:Na+/pantothenate symporter
MSAALVPVNLLFLALGAVLFIYAEQFGIGIPTRTDDLFPTIALQHLGAVAGVVFMIGLISAAYSSADSALTALTTSFMVDILGIEKKTSIEEIKKRKLRYLVHLLISFTVLMIIVGFRAIRDDSVISMLFTIAGYTYGPLLGLYAFGMFTKYSVKDRWVPLVAVVSPLLCYVLSVYDQVLLNGYNFGFELLVINGIFTALGLLIISKKNQ